MALTLIRNIKRRDCTRCRTAIPPGSWVSVTYNDKGKPKEYLCDTCSNKHTYGGKSSDTISR